MAIGGHLHEKKLLTPGEHIHIVKRTSEVDTRDPHNFIINVTYYVGESDQNKKISPEGISFVSKLELLLLYFL